MSPEANERLSKLYKTGRHPAKQHKAELAEEMRRHD